MIEERVRLSEGEWERPRLQGRGRSPDL